MAAHEACEAGRFDLQAPSTRSPSDRNASGGRQRMSSTAPWCKGTGADVRLEGYISRDGKDQLLMLLILIPIAWLAVVTIVVAVCRASALGDSSADPGVERAYCIRDGLVVWDRDAAVALRYQDRAMPQPAALASR